jgi:hypothetical protein
MASVAPAVFRWIIGTTASKRSQVHTLEADAPSPSSHSTFFTIKYGQNANCFKEKKESPISVQTDRPAERRAFTFSKADSRETRGRSSALRISSFRPEE